MVEMVKERGYVTKDFPFLDESLRYEIESVLNESENYWDFGEKLAKRAVNPNTHHTLVFLAYYHLSRLNNSAALNRFLDAHKELLLPPPFYFLERPVYFVDGIDYNQDKVTIENAIELNDNQVITFYMLMRLYRSSPFGSPEEEWVKARIEELFAKNEGLRLHKADFIGHTGYRLKVLGKPQESLSMLFEALKLARESGDKWHQTRLLVFIAEVTTQWMIGRDSYTKAKEYLGEAMEICREINDKAGIATVLQNMCIYAYSRGELGEAFDCQLESISIQGEIGEVNLNAATNIAGLYMVSGDMKSAREWYDMVQNYENELGPYAYFGDVSYYLSLGNIQKAQEILDRAKELAISYGVDTALGRFYRITGDIEKANGDLESAMDSYKKALDINELASRQLRVRICLVKLVEVELEQFLPTKANRNDEYSGELMKRLEKETQENDIPGFYARLELLKSELRMRQGRHEEAKALLDSMIEFTNNRSTRFIHRDSLAMREKWKQSGPIPADSLRFLRKD